MPVMRLRFPPLLLNPRATGNARSNGEDRFKVDYLPREVMIASATFFGASL
jgi:hypothetical protein